MCLQSISSRYALAHSRYEFTNAQWMGWICAACGLRLQSCGCVYRIVTKLGMDLQFPLLAQRRSGGTINCHTLSKRSGIPISLPAKIPYYSARESDLILAGVATDQTTAALSQVSSLEAPPGQPLVRRPTAGEVLGLANLPFEANCGS